MDMAVVTMHIYTHAYQSVVRVVLCFSMSATAAAPSSPMAFLSRLHEMSGMTDWIDRQACKY